MLIYGPGPACPAWQGKSAIKVSEPAWLPGTSCQEIRDALAYLFGDDQRLHSDPLVPTAPIRVADPRLHADISAARRKALPPDRTPAPTRPSLEDVAPAAHGTHSIDDPCCIRRQQNQTGPRLPERCQLPKPSPGPIDRNAACAPVPPAASEPRVVQRAQPPATAFRIEEEGVVAQMIVVVGHENVGTPSAQTARGDRTRSGHFTPCTPIASAIAA